MLILDPSSNEAEQTINILRNSGHAVRATQITSEEELETALEKQSWDLFIVRDGLSDPSPEQCMNIVKHYGSDIHFIMTTVDYSVERNLEILRLGMKDLVPEESDEYFKLVVKRELSSIEDRRGRKQSDKALLETDKRNELLLDSSTEAIAYIIDGMHIYANGAYMELFGYDDPEEIASVPVMDLMDSEYHKGFKKFLKDHSKGIESEDFAFTGLNESKGKFEAFLSLSDSQYDGEDCTQAFVKTADVSDAELEQKLKAMSAEDRLTGLYNEEYFIDQVTVSISNASTENQLSTVLYIDLDGFDKIQDEHGITNSNLFLKEVSYWLIENAPDEAIIARVGDSTFTILIKIQKPDDAEITATNLCNSYSDNLFEVADHTIKDTLSIGVCMIQENSSSAVDVLSNAHFAASNVQSKEGNGIRIHDQSLDSLDSRDDAQTAMKIQDAMDAGHIKIMYEPIVKLQGNAKKIFHAALTYEKEQGNNRPITDIFDIGLRTSTALKLDKWLLTESFGNFSNYLSDHPNCILKVNLTAASLLSENLIESVTDLMSSLEIPEKSVIIEFNEDIAVAHLKKAIEVIKGFSDNNIMTAMNGFGKTLDSQSVINSINCKLFQWLTLDNEFFTDFASNGEIQTKVEELVAFAITNELSTIAPEVSDPSSLALLWPMKVGHIQGEYIASASDSLEFDFSLVAF